MAAAPVADAPIEDFERSWRFIRGITHAFIEQLDDRYWLYAPHPSCQPLAKQFRHMIWIAGLYNDALANRVVDFSKKKSCYDGGLDRTEILAGLRAQDDEFARVLAEIKAAATGATLIVDFDGKPMRFGEFTNVVVQHEALHQGMWSIYARLGGFAIPELWQTEWLL
jgi:hypothetical protein